MVQRPESLNREIDNYEIHTLVYVRLSLDLPGNDTTER